MRSAVIGCTVVLASVLTAAAARAQTVDACDSQGPRRGGWILDVTYRSHGVAVNNIKQMTLVAHSLPGQGHEALVFLLGGVPITDGASNTFLAAEKHVRPSCVDVDGDGFAGIVSLQFVLRDVRTGELVTGLIVPNDGELDDNGEEQVTIVIGDVTVTGTAQSRFFVVGTELPD
jgi:hypothetical protein